MVLSEMSNSSRSDAMTTQRFYSVYAGGDSNSYHVIEAGRRNEFGERYCVRPYLTEWEANALVARLNQSTTTPE